MPSNQCCDALSIRRDFMDVISLIIDADRFDIFHFEILQVLMGNEPAGFFRILYYFIGQIAFIK